MKLKHLLFTGALTTVVAVMLLNVVLPQTAEARTVRYRYFCYSCVSGSLTMEIAARKAMQQALTECQNGQYCNVLRGGVEVPFCQDSGAGSYCP